MIILYINFEEQQERYTHKNIKRQALKGSIYDSFQNKLEKSYRNSCSLKEKLFV